MRAEVTKELREDPDVKKWLSRVKESSTRPYALCFRRYLIFAGMTPSELLDEFETDKNNGRKDRGKPEQRLMEFFNKMLKEGNSKKYCALHFTAVRSFYKTFGCVLTLKTPKAIPKKENRKRELTPQDVKKIVEHAPTLRDRAIILMMFQGGFDVSTLCSLNYEDVNRELEGGKDPLKIAVIREKEDVEYFTFISTDAIDVLKAYLDERRASCEAIHLDSPLFVKEGYAKLSRERITPNLIQKMMRETVVKAGIVTKDEMERADMNPARPHALRSAFSTILRLNGFDPLVIDHMQGHNLPYNGAYYIPPPEKVREVYAEVAPQLSINQSAKTTKELESKLLERIGRLETEKKAMTARIQSTENELDAFRSLATEQSNSLIAKMQSMEKEHLVLKEAVRLIRSGEGKLSFTEEGKKILGELVERVEKG